MIAGTQGPGGLSGFETYSIEPKISHGAVITSFNNAPWSQAWQGFEPIVLESNGKLVFCNKR